MGSIIGLYIMFMLQCEGPFAGVNNLVDTNPSFYVAKFKRDRACAISFTFDDGVKEHYQLVVPQLEKNGFRGTFWINGNTINTAEKEGIANKLPRITWDELRDMAKQGHEISNHGWSHKNLTTCTDEEIRVEIERNDSIIESKVGIHPVTYCYAGNKMNKKVIQLASENRVGTRTQQFQIGRRSTSEKLRTYTQNLIASGEWSATMIHGINTGYDVFESDSILWDFFSYVKSRENVVWVAPFREVAAYTSEQKDLIINIFQEEEKFIISPVCSLDSILFNVPLTMVIKKKFGETIIVKQGNMKLPTELIEDKVLFDFDPHGAPIIVEYK